MFSSFPSPITPNQVCYWMRSFHSVTPYWKTNGCRNTSTRPSAHLPECLLSLMGMLYKYGWNWHPDPNSVIDNLTSCLASTSTQACTDMIPHCFRSPNTALGQAYTSTGVRSNRVEDLRSGMKYRHLAKHILDKKASTLLIFRLRSYNFIQIGCCISGNWLDLWLQYKNFSGSSCFHTESSAVQNIPL